MLRFVLLLTFCSSVQAEQPAFDSIDYASPAKYLAIPESLGDREAIAKQASALKSTKDRRTVSNVLHWMATQLKYEADQAYHWRNYDTVVAERCYGGCADQAIVCGVLLKSAGIPTIWVKTMDVPWIWSFKRKRPFQSWSGHVFLEVYLDGQWVLLDPGAAKVYLDYSTKSRILPGNRFAYHKGNDPKTMIMSLQWEAWKEQTTAFFTALDESLLPVDPLNATVLKPRCFVIANPPYYQFLGEIARQNGLGSGPSFNTGYDKYLPMAKGHTILIETNAGIPIVDMDILERYFPSASNGIETGKIVVGDTTLVFVDFASALSNVTPEATEQKNAPELRSERSLKPKSTAATR